MGLARTAHAGEDDGPQNVWEAVDILGSYRVDHGVRAIKDETLVEHLAQKDIMLAVTEDEMITLARNSYLYSLNGRRLLPAFGAWAAAWKQGGDA